jgi:hypothetical protein
MLQSGYCSIELHFELCEENSNDGGQLVGLRLVSGII